jgi:hypothetical protein
MKHLDAYEMAKQIAEKLGGKQTGENEGCAFALLTTTTSHRSTFR